MTAAADTPIALTIASSDSGGGAGIQADLKAFARCGVHGTSVIVALTAQNTTGVSAIHQCPPEFVAAQLTALLTDLPPRAVKTGMLFSAPIIRTVAEALAGTGLPLVIDPVMLASSGARLLRDDAVSALTGLLFPLATVVTPNLMEAQALTGLDTEDRAELTEALVALGAPAALVTGGHGERPVDHLYADGRHCDSPCRGTRCRPPTAPAAPIRRRWPPAWRWATHCRWPLGELLGWPVMRSCTGWPAWARVTGRWMC